MMTLKANPKLSRQLTLEGWRDKAGGGREGLLLTTDVCENLPCPCGSGLKYKRCCLVRAA